METGQTLAASARSLGLVEQTLHNWVKAERQGKLKGGEKNLVGTCAREDGARYPGKSDGVLRERAEMKYPFIHNHREIWPIGI